MKVNITGAINGYCVYTKDGIDSDEADVFFSFAAVCIKNGLPIQYTWSDGTRFVQGLGCPVSFWTTLTDSPR